MMHLIGKFMLVTYLNDGPLATTERSITEYERATAGLDHAEAGVLVAEKWNLASDIQEVISCRTQYLSAYTRPIVYVM